MRSSNAPWVEVPTLRNDPPRHAMFERLLTRARRRAVTRTQRLARRSMFRLAYLWISFSVVLMMAKLGWEATLKLIKR